MAATDELVGMTGSKVGLFALLTHPARHWPAMAAAPLTGRQAFFRYAVPLAAVPAVAKGAGLLIFGVPIYGVLLKPAPVMAAISAALTYGLDLISVLVLGFAIHIFSAVFNGENKLGPAMKLAIFSSAPGWIGGVFLVLPTMGVLPPLGALSAAFALYGLYVFYLGLPITMCVRRDRCPVYAGVAIMVFLALWGADTLIVGVFDRATMTPAPGATLHVKGADLDLSKLGMASKSLQNALKNQTAPPPAATTDELESLIPSDLPSGFTRSQVTSKSANLGKLSGAMAQGTYAKDKDAIVLTVADLGAAGGLAQAVTLSANKHTDTAYQKSGQVAGRMTVEKYDRTTNNGEYDILIANRFLVQAKGHTSVEILQAAVQAVPFDRLEAMAKG
jgi:hypothetical protein